MQRRNIISLLFLGSCFNPASARADERSDAFQAVNTFNSFFDQNRMNDIWRDLTSQYMYQRVTQQAFIAQLTITRNQLGGAPAANRQLIQENDGIDSPSGLKFRSFRFRAQYPAMAVYQDITVTPEQGRWKLSGFFFNPA